MTYLAGPPTRRRRRGRGLGAGVAFTAPQVFTSSMKAPSAPTTSAKLPVVTIPTFKLPTVPGIPTIPFPIIPTPKTTGSTTPPPTTAGPQVPVMIMPPGGGATDQGYSTVQPPTSIDISVAPGADTSAAMGPSGGSSSLPWGAIALGAAALGALYLATR